MSNTNISPTKEQKIYSAEEISKILHISMGKTYELCNSGQFRVIRIGRIIRVSKESFDHWLNHQEGGI
ncbi:helix-turn-helix domain-containing protein [Ohessyouella blattaphilus]|uniref:Helix-turn-helix domain-containing protein n=1 Tax=Ohessyouella blattaphilus TaxID=2949333 RepID=A0ABT1EMF0_9FIRM|nr:helix-turn-helix domain-containing protein [Ohessyouella blattaphilus]MCP1110881.1 helix-turn-helix domain-containing protein [Ohessyouella blattaphilus]MCR8564275.1 helix-turn-helix domain-containing protein [Ohessyouella blattaphilus]